MKGTMHPIIQDMIEVDRAKLVKKRKRIIREDPRSQREIDDRDRRLRDVNLQIAQLDDKLGAATDA